MRRHGIVLPYFVRAVTSVDPSLVQVVDWSPLWSVFSNILDIFCPPQYYVSLSMSAILRPRLTYSKLRSRSNLCRVDLLNVGKPGSSLTTAKIAFSVRISLLNQNSCTFLRIPSRSKSSIFSLNEARIFVMFGDYTVFVCLYSAIVDSIVLWPIPISFDSILTTYFTLNAGCCIIFVLYMLIIMSFWRLLTN